MLGIEDTEVKEERYTVLLHGADYLVAEIVINESYIMVYIM